MREYTTLKLHDWEKYVAEASRVLNIMDLELVKEALENLKEVLIHLEETFPEHYSNRLFSMEKVRCASVSAIFTTALAKGYNVKYDDVFRYCRHGIYFNDWALKMVAYLENKGYNTQPIMEALRR